jgi:lipoprotein-releasing system ATP-binding protein
VGRSDQAPALHLQDLQRSYSQGSRIIEVLKGATASLYSGEAVALLGPSGAGKSTLLHIAGLLERPDGGAVVIDGVDCVKLGDSERTRMRRSEIGFVYQFHHLLPEFSALENIVLPQMIAGVAKPAARKRGMELLELVGLGARASHRPARLSGGEQQRVAIARALANRPKLLIADEPTGNLDHKTAEGVFAMLAELVRGGDFGALVATHNLDLAARMDRVLELRDGVLVQH